MGKASSVTSACGRHDGLIADLQDHELAHLLGVAATRPRRPGPAVVLDILLWDPGNRGDGT